MFTLLDLCVSSLRRGHANLLCIVPILTDGTSEEGHIMISLTAGHLGTSVDTRTPGSFPRVHACGKNRLGKKLSAPEGVPRPSPTLVLTGPYHA